MQFLREFHAIFSRILLNKNKIKEKVIAMHFTSQSIAFCLRDGSIPLDQSRVTKIRQSL